MFCNYCGAANPDDGRFCAVCGKGLVPTGSSTPGNLPPRYAETELSLQPGFVLMNRYRIRQELGAGGMGRVYLADDETLRIPAAIKVLRDLLSRDPGSVQRLKKEAKLAIQLSHPNIVRVHDYHEADVIRFLVMEYLDGETLAHRLVHENSIGEVEVRRIAHAICSGLEHAHEKKIIHRDLKPANILLGKEGSIKIADFGIARVCRDSMSRLTSQLDSGTLIYMSPEQLMGESSEQSDIYSLGVILYELISGDVPFHSGDIQAQIREKSPQPLPEASRDLNDLVLRCLVKKPPGRPQTVRQVREWLEGRSAVPSAQSRITRDAGAASQASAPQQVPQPRTQRTYQAAGPADTSEAVAGGPDGVRHNAPSPPARDIRRAAALPASSAPKPKPPLRSAAGQQDVRSVKLILQGALVFGLGAIPEAELLIRFCYPYFEFHYLALLVVWMLAWGAIGAKVMNLRMIGFASGFVLSGAALAVALFAMHISDDRELLYGIGCGLAASAALGTAFLRKPWRSILSAGSAFAAFPVMVQLLYPAVYRFLGYGISFTVTSILCGTISGALFGIVVRNWERDEAELGA